MFEYVHSGSLHGSIFIQCWNTHGRKAALDLGLHLSIHLLRNRVFQESFDAVLQKGVEWPGIEASVGAVLLCKTEFKAILDCLDCIPELILLLPHLHQLGDHVIRHCSGNFVYTTDIISHQLQGTKLVKAHLVDSTFCVASLRHLLNKAGKNRLLKSRAKVVNFGTHC